MYFGLNRQLDEQSLIRFLKLYGDERLSTVLAPRLTDDEIHTVVDTLMIVMRRHLSNEEYHRLFLQEKDD
ncbi:MAG: cytoplasmic protein [Desulfobulbaceae bacterium]|nr:cytoplasmic protein [Desulfobulbaceae bacterium]